MFHRYSSDATAKHIVIVKVHCRQTTSIQCNSKANIKCLNY